MLIDWERDLAIMSCGRKALKNYNLLEQLASFADLVHRLDRLLINGDSLNCLYLFIYLVKLFLTF